MRGGHALVSWLLIVEPTGDIELLAGTSVDDGIVKGPLRKHGPEGLLDEMVLVLDQHLRNPLQDQGRFG